ncbi:MAG: hypothetical protein OHK93_004508 [Ramalina farinacea]|uniref:Uncharacterized protein n=1 Tax=Ramalina farinacea TaxID=258253 RepID=A0AA43QU76_9LECA|nr:hypothetical protein [Ramalina farinacea]
MIVSILLALTYPGGRQGDTLFPGSASVQGLFDGGDRLTILLPLTMMFVFSATNVMYVAPKTISTMWKLQLGALAACLGPELRTLEVHADDEDQNPSARRNFVVIWLPSRKTMAGSILVCDATSNHHARDTKVTANGVPESVRDRKTIQKDGSKSPELKALTNKFLIYHGASYGCNMATVATSVCYALCVAVRGL